MKNYFKSIFLTILSLLLFIPFTSALLMPSIVNDTLRRVFSGGIPEDYVLRMLITLLIFLVFYWGAAGLFTKGRGFGEKKTNMFRWTIALVIALIVGLFTPITLLHTYKTILLLSIPLLATAGILVLAHKAAKSKHNEGYVGAALLYLLLITIISITAAKAHEFGIMEYRLMTGFSFIDMFELIIFITFILMVVNFIKAFGRPKP